MIKSFTLSNFKAFREASLDFARVTVLIGPNGTGKSSGLQALKLLKQSIGQAGLQINGNLIDLGTYEDIVPQHMRDRKIRFGVSIETPPDDRALAPWDAGSLQQYDAEFGDGGQLDDQRIHITNPTQSLTVRWSRFGGSTVTPGNLSFENGRVLAFSPSSGVLQPFSLNMSGPFSQTEQVAFQELCTAVTMAVQQVYVVPPVRGFESTSYPLEPNPIIDMFDTRSVESHASRVLSTIAYRRELEEQISDYSDRILKIRLRIKLVPGQRVTAEAYNGAKTNLVNEGFGANQLMILLAQMVIAPTGAVIGLEEAEIHLHPLAQSDFAAILVELATRSDKQIVLTTHSEHIVMGLLTHVARGALSPDDLRIYYFAKDSDGVASLERLDVDEHGRLSGGLKGFFEANVSELDHYLAALAKQSD